MTRIVGARGSRRRRRVFLLVPLASLAALILAVAGSATNTDLGKFEIDGDLVATTSNGSTEDWVNTANTGADSASAALKCVTVATCTATNIGLVTSVTDGSGTGEGSLFRDLLKVGDASLGFTKDNTTFTNGDKENGPTSGVTNIQCPAGQPCTSDVPYNIVTGSIPPNKDDLFDVATNTIVSGTDSELDLGMVRTNNNGSSHLDFELNRVNWLSGSTTGATCGSNGTGIANFKCPVRTEGDLLISFEINPDGTAAERFFVWDLPGGTDANGHGRGDIECQGPLSGNENTCPWEEIQPPLASGTGTPTVLTSVNSAALPAPPWGFKNPNGTTGQSIPIGGWFEAGINLSALGFPPSCPGFGVASAKSRSSGSSVTSSLTDLAGPFPVDLNTCGKITIIKDTVPNAAQDFSYTTTGGLSPATFSLDDDADPALSNTQVYNNQAPGNYTVTETLPVFGYALTDLTCVVNHSEAGSPTTASPSGGSATATSTITLGNLGDVTCTYTNTRQLGAIKVIKTSSKTGAALAGAVFSVTGPNSFSTTLTTGANGTACVDNLPFGSYTVTETSAPPGYIIDDPAARTVTVDNNAACSDAPYVGESSSFTDTPTADIQVRFRDGGSGATSATIDCDNTTGTTSTAGTTGWDSTKTITGIHAPTTVICTIVIDP